MEFNGLTVTALRFAADTAALVLIWLVQLVIYPAFLYSTAADFHVWHPLYTNRVTLVVMPVMLSQLGLYVVLAWQNPCWSVLLSLGLIVVAWGITFFWAVPLHGALDQEGDHLPLATQLISVNWWRTLVWSVVWCVSLLVCLGIISEQARG